MIAYQTQGDRCRAPESGARGQLANGVVPRVLGGLMRAQSRPAAALPASLLSVQRMFTALQVTQWLAVHGRCGLVSHVDACGDMYSSRKVGSTPGQVADLAA